jgi:hypothetical protein
MPHAASVFRNDELTIPMLEWVMTEITNELMYEVLKAIRADVTDLKRDARTPRRNSMGCAPR